MKVFIKLLLLLTFAGHVVAQQPAKGLTVGITLHPYYSYVANVIGDKGRVLPLIDSGFNPHNYRLNPADINRLNQLDALVVNGIGHDEFVMFAVDRVNPPNLTMIYANKDVPLLGHGDKSNPHTFVSIDASIRQVYSIAKALGKLDPVNAKYFSKNKKIILNDLSPIYEKSGVSERPDIWVVTGTMNIVNKIFELIESCKKEVLIAIPKAGEGLVKQALPKLRQLNEKGVKITILTSDKFDKEVTKGLNRLATLKSKKGLFGGGIIADKQYVVILLGPEISHSSTSEIVAICTDHVGLSSFASEYFEYLLKDATEIK